MSDRIYTILIIGVIAAVTALLRFLPFLVFRGQRPIPQVISYLGTVLPYAVMAMLVVYCLKDISFGSMLEWLPSVISVLAVIFMYVWKRNTLISIVGGTVCYMLLIRLLV